jgi:acetylornithine deacetylase/succinyl-diaminopimelate desuccinylase-like protein
MFEGRKTFTVEVTQKIPLWLRLTATDRPSHGASPRPTSSVSRLIRALSRIQDSAFEPRIVPAVDAYFKGLATRQEGEMREAASDMASAVQDPEFLMRLQLEFPRLHALTRNTCSITRLEGSPKINVVPPKAHAEIDCRLLPDQDPGEFVDLLRTTINDPSVEIEVLMVFSAAVSPTDSVLYRAITQVISERFPDASIVPGVAAGFTDSHYFRDLGIASYGFTPTVTPVEESARVHGNDERISVEEFRRGGRLLQEIVEKVVY